MATEGTAGYGRVEFREPANWNLWQNSILSWCSLAPVQPPAPHHPPPKSLGMLDEIENNKCIVSSKAGKRDTQVPEDTDATDLTIGSRGCGVYTPTGTVGSKQQDEFPAESVWGSTCECLGHRTGEMGIWCSVV